MLLHSIERCNMNWQWLFCKKYFVLICVATCSTHTHYILWITNNNKCENDSSLCDRLIWRRCSCKTDQNILEFQLRMLASCSAHCDICIRQQNNGPCQHVKKFAYFHKLFVVVRSLMFMITIPHHHHYLHHNTEYTILRWVNERMNEYDQWARIVASKAVESSLTISV